MATCKECIHYEVCRALCKSKEELMPCVVFKDRSRFVELPCKAGDTVFILLKSQDILKYKVFYINIFRGEGYDDINIVLDRNYYRIEFTKERFKYELGKTIFLTKEQAEQALKERDPNGQSQN